LTIDDFSCIIHAMITKKNCYYVSDDTSRNVSDSKTNLETAGISFCTGIAIVTEYGGRTHRFLSHAYPDLLSAKLHIGFAEEFLGKKKNFINTLRRFLLPQMTVKKAQLISSMGYYHPKFNGGLHISDRDRGYNRITETLKEFFDSLNLSQDFTFDFHRASAVNVTHEGLITTCSHQETMEHISRIYKGSPSSIDFAREALETCPSFSII